jgi:hypothetical protein
MVENSPNLVTLKVKHLEAGLPDGIFSSKESEFLFILEGTGVENFGIFYRHLCSIFVVFWYMYVFFWYVVPRKIWQPCSEDALNRTFCLHTFVADETFNIASHKIKR